MVFEGAIPNYKDIYDDDDDDDDTKKTCNSISISNP